VELRDYIRIVRRRWLSIVLCTVLAVVASAVVTSQMTSQYESSAKLFISSSASSSSGDAYQGSLFSAQRVASYADLVAGKELAQRVVDDLDLDLSATDLAEKVTAEAAPDTVLLGISVTDPDAQEAQRLAQAFSVQLASLVAELETPPGNANPVLKATIVDSASLPRDPVSPQPLRNLALAALLGLLLGLGMALVRELLDTSIKSTDDIAEATDAAVMAGISFDSTTTKTPLVSSLSSHEPRVEAFRVLRTNLQFVDVDNPNKAFVVTSSVPAEGKSTTAANTAITLAQTGQKVLLVDGDLRRPQIARLLGLDDAVGLTTVLVGRVSADDALQRHETGIDVLTSGVVPPNPAELLQSHSMADLLTDLRGRYDVIVIDAPPLLPVTDAALIAAQTDGALLVVRHGRTTKDQLHAAVERLAGVNAHALGVVFNMTPRKGGRGEYGYGYGYAPQPAVQKDEPAQVGRKAAAGARANRG
jgi:capsular exopolysaccharide synthesis family protein